MKKFLLAALMAGVASSAFAADLPTHKAPPQAPVVYAPPFTWTGFYVGVNGGWGFGDLSNSNFSAPSGGLLGAQAGYNYQMGQFVAGLEADLDWTDLNKSNIYALGTNKFSTGTMTTERLRAGIALDRALIYVTGGYAGISTSASFNDTVNGLTASETTWRNGGAIGGGVEYAFTNNITAKAEYLYVPLSDQTYFAGTPDGERNSFGIDIIRAGLNYKF